MAAPRPLTDVGELMVLVFRFSSTRPISLGAMATHHIIDEDLEGLRPFGHFDAESMGIQYIVGHNIDFDWRMLGRPKVAAESVRSPSRGRCGPTSTRTRWAPWSITCWTRKPRGAWSKARTPP